MNTSLNGIRVLDLSRVLAGPFCTQTLGDLGAEIIKIEKPIDGDDTRKWGPPFLKKENGEDTSESAYYLSTNRNKKSISIDIRLESGQQIIKELLQSCDILIENFKTDGLKKYGLSYDDLKHDYPALIYTSITGFGQTGPYAHEPGYDFLAQAMGGLMTYTGEINGTPMKAGVALSDIMTGLQAAIGTLAALNHRKNTGKGQHVDVSLLDCTLASMTNIAQYYLTSGNTAPRLGNAHSTIVPYQAFEAEDGHVILAIGNDGQFERFCNFIDKKEWAENLKFKTNSERVKNRDELVSMIKAIIQTRKVGDWVSGLIDISVPCGPVNSIDQTFAMDQIKAREMQISMQHPLAGPIDLIGNPIKMSETPVTYNKAPPVCGQDTTDILKGILKYSDEKIEELRQNKVLG